MENRIIGEKNVFSIELSDWTDDLVNPFGLCKIWIGGHCLHDDGVKVFYPSVLASISGVATCLPHADGLSTLLEDPNAVLAYLLEEDNGNFDDNLFLFCEGFDDFLVLFFKGAQSTKFVFCRVPVNVESMFLEPIYHFDVLNGVIRSVAVEFRDFIYGG